METRDQATELAAKIFNRIELEGKCQPHIIADEIRCRLGAAPDLSAAPQKTEDAMCETARKLCRMAVNDVGAYGRLSPAFQNALSKLYDVLYSEGWRP